MPNQEYFVDLMPLFSYKKETGIAENFSVTTSICFPKNLRDMWDLAISILFSLIHQYAPETASIHVFPSEDGKECK